MQDLFLVESINEEPAVRVYGGTFISSTRLETDEAAVFDAMTVATSAVSTSRIDKLTLNAQNQVPLNSTADVAVASTSPRHCNVD
jgi:hypothetical protein